MSLFGDAAFQDIDPLQILNLGDPNEDLENPLSPTDFTALQIGARDWTVQTLITQILNGNIQLDPRFQRRSAWNDTKRSRFIESLILGVPIPQIVLAEIRDEPGRFVVIDGKQRLLTLASLQSVEYDFWDKKRFQNLLTLRDLEEVPITDFIHADVFRARRRQLANQSIRAALVVGTRSDDVLYDIFYRVNSGSVPLSGQELRQVLIRGEFSNYLFEVTNSQQPVHRVMNIPGPDQRMYDAELVLRALSNALRLVPYQGNLKAYLDETTRRLNASWADLSSEVMQQYSHLNEAILKLTEVLEYRQIGRRLLGSRFEGRLNKALLEVEIYSFRYVSGEIKSKQDEFLAGLSDLCADYEFRDSIELTTKSIPRFQMRFARFAKLMQQVFDVEVPMPYIAL